MKAFINKITGTLMYVDDSRVDEYIEAGYEPALDANEDETVSEVEKNTDTDETEEDSKKNDKKSGKKGA